MNTSPTTSLSIEQALQIAARQVDAGQLAPAETRLRQILLTQARNPFALHLLGIIAHRVGKTSDAIDLIGQAIEHLPSVAQFHSNRGEMCRLLLRLNEAISHGERAVQLDPRQAVAFSNLGIAYYDYQQYDKAEACQKKALALDPNLVEAHNNLGNALNRQNQPAEAITCFRRALQLRPNYAEAHNNLGNTLKEQGKLFEAEASLRQALQLKPDHFEAHNSLGVIYMDWMRPKEATTYFRRALQFKPNHAGAQNNLGVALQDLGQLDESETCFRAALRNQPSFAMAHSNLLFWLTHREDLPPEQVFAEHCHFAAQHEVPLKADWTAHTNLRNENKKLRIGFVSADLRQHAVAHYLAAVWHAIDRTQIELWAYSNSTREDEMTHQLRDLVDHWQVVSALSDAALAEQIRTDAIDILIDLSGHTAHNRLLTFARKPAPLQATWIGYPATSGLSAIDYVFGDRFVTPPGKIDDFFVEKIIRLPSSGTFEPSLHATEVTPLPALRNGYVTFGSFNRLAKLGDAVIQVWCEVLQDIPNSRMLFGSICDDATAHQLAARFAAHGIDPVRLSFHPRQGMREYLALHEEVDIILDSFPFNGGATTQHALWAGVPVLTLAGLTRPERGGAGILGRVGLEDWITDSPAAYRQRASEAARDLPALATLRAGMRQRLLQSPLRQPETVARGLEAAFRVMWQRWCQGLPAESFNIETLATREAPQ